MSCQSHPTSFLSSPLFPFSLLPLVRVSFPTDFFSPFICDLVCFGLPVGGGWACERCWLVPCSQSLSSFTTILNASLEALHRGFISRLYIISLGSANLAICKGPSEVAKECVSFKWRPSVSCADLVLWVSSSFATIPHTQLPRLPSIVHLLLRRFSTAFVALVNVSRVGAREWPVTGDRGWVRPFGPLPGSWWSSRRPCPRTSKEGSRKGDEQGPRLIPRSTSRFHPSAGPLDPLALSWRGRS